MGLYEDDTVWFEVLRAREYHAQLEQERKRLEQEQKRHEDDWIDDFFKKHRHLDEESFSADKKLPQKKVRHVSKKKVSRSVSNSGTNNGKPVAEIVSAESLVVIDGSNIIGMDENLRVDILKAIVEALKKDGYKYKIFVDKSVFGWLRNKKADESGVDYLSKGGTAGDVIVAPSKTEADGQILQLAEFESNVHIVSNDRYRDYVELHPWLKNKGSANRLHGINLVPMGDGRVRVLIAGFNLDIVV